MLRLYNLYTFQLYIVYQENPFRLILLFNYSCTVIIKNQIVILFYLHMRQTYPSFRRGSGSQDVLLSLLLEGVDSCNKG